MNTIKRILFVLMILASGFVSLVLWGVAVTMFKLGAYDIGVATIAVLAVLIACNIILIKLSEE